MKRVVRKLRYTNEIIDRRRKNSLRKRINIDLTNNLYELVKLRVKARNTSMRKWVTRAINRELRRELDVL